MVLTYSAHLIQDCPKCDSVLTYEMGFPGDFWHPDEPEQLYCESCGWEADEPIDAYLSFYDDDGSL